MPEVVQRGEKDRAQRAHERRPGRHREDARDVVEGQRQL